MNALFSSFVMLNNSGDIRMLEWWVPFPINLKISRAIYPSLVILKDSFIHYMDESISFLKNGAILDLDSVNGENAVAFYNITNAERGVNFSVSYLREREPFFF